MSASIRFAPRRTDFSLDKCVQPSRFIDTMTKVFGDEPWNLEEDDYARLMAMEAAQPSNGFGELAEAVAEFGPLKVWPEI